MNEENPRYSDTASTGHRVFLTYGFRKNPICPIHKKRAIIREPYDEIGVCRWFCIDCILNAIYKKTVKVEPEELHKWYLEATKGMKNVNPVAQVPYDKLPSTQKLIDVFIADKVNKKLKFQPKKEAE